VPEDCALTRPATVTVHFIPAKIQTNQRASLRGAETVTEKASDLPAPNPITV
jgi:hypothetical protein